MHTFKFSSCLLYTPSARSRESQNKSTAYKDLCIQHSSNSHQQLQSQCALRPSSASSFSYYFQLSHSLSPTHCPPMASYLETLPLTLPLSRVKSNSTPLKGALPTPTAEKTSSFAPLALAFVAVIRVHAAQLAVAAVVVTNAASPDTGAIAASVAL
jgi:hypothetical protein